MCPLLQLRRPLPVLFVLLVALPGTPSAQAQGQQEWEQLRTSGVIKGVGVGGMVVQTAEGETWNIALPKEAKDVSYSASADVAFLRPGMVIQFSAMVNRKGEIVSEIPSLTVFTPLAATDLGIIPEGAPGPSPTDVLFTDEKEVKKPVKVPEQISCYVGGQFVSLRGKKMVVAVGGRQYKCDLTENAQVKVAVSDLSLVQPGDKVELEARYYANRKALGAQANRVTITAANPLVDLKKKMKTTEKSKEKGDKEKEKDDEPKKAE